MGLRWKEFVMRISLGGGPQPPFPNLRRERTPATHNRRSTHAPKKDLDCVALAGERGNGVCHVLISLHLSTNHEVRGLNTLCTRGEPGGYWLWTQGAPMEQAYNCTCATRAVRVRRWHKAHRGLQGFVLSYQREPSIRLAVTVT